MSLGDELRYLRALRGGGNLRQIEMEAGLEPGELRSMEQRYRRVGEDDTVLQKVAAYYKVPIEELQWHRQRFRKALSAYLQHGLETGALVRVHLRTGGMLNGSVCWWDMGAFGLEPTDGKPLTVVQRHAVLDWSETLGDQEAGLND